MISEEANEKNGGAEEHVFQAKTQDVYDEPGLDPIYHAKAQILNDALQEIGMGKYQASSCFPFSFSSSLGDVCLTPSLLSGSYLASPALAGYRKRANLSSNQFADHSGVAITSGRWVQALTVINDRH